MKKKICILSTVNLKHMSLISLYTEYLEENAIEYDIIYIDKYHEEEENNAANIYKYDLYIERDWPFLRKLKKYWKFKEFASKILKENEYDFIITWNVFTAVMFQDILKKNYKNKYCINIRDISTNPFIKWRLKKALESSAFSTVSSKGFIKHLPKSKYEMVHSLNTKLLKNSKPRLELQDYEKPLTITYIGYMCYYENVYKLIDHLGNDKRYRLKFIGEGTQSVKDYAEKKGIMNVECYGRFEPSQTAGFIQDADIIYNLYGVGEANLDAALSIKLYYAAYLNVPILVFEGTYMAEVSKKYGFGYVLRFDDFNNLGNDLRKWYYNIDYKELYSRTNTFKNEIKESHKNLDLLLDKYVKG